MAGWSDISGAGSITAGYALDIKFFNTYINALKEKEQFLNITTSISEIDDSDPYIITRSDIISIINAYKKFMTDIDWVRTDRFDNPENYGPITTDTSDIWTTAQIQALITVDVYNIINSASSYYINDLLSADLWNGLYTLYKDVFNIVEQKDIRATVLAWERYGFTGSLQTTGSDEPADITAFLAQGSTDYGNETVALLSSGGGLKNFITNITQNSNKGEFPTEDPRDFSTSDFSGGYQYNVQAYSVRKHTIKNFDDDYVKLEVSAPGYLLENSEYDSWGDDSIIVPRDDETVSAWISGFSQIQLGVDATEVISYPFDSSTLTVTGWELKGYDPGIPAYNADESHMLYDYDDMYDGTDGLDRRIDKQNNFELIASQTGTGATDLYYKTNVSSMVFHAS